MNDWRLFTDAANEERTKVAWHEVLREIASLDGQSKTLVHAAYEHYLDFVVSGGDNGYVLIQWKENANDQAHYVLTASFLEEIGSVSLTTEGEQIHIPAEWAIPIEKAIPLIGDLLQSCELKDNAFFQWVLLEKETRQ
ncbi:hypothetical protein [Brevibacillus daliensis]|uniref:hypothetical protein n=1 Tax=Brevibacillus daliensis TaxID=2892995 RepID=UPI001E2B3D7B|nr:hypothetical protein [Brevibacillus daliensis]